jgi:hypothetical protein
MKTTSTISRYLTLAPATIAPALLASVLWTLVFFSLP